MRVGSRIMDNRIIVKIGGEALSGEGHIGIDPDEARAIALKIREVHALGIQIGLVIGGGNLFRGQALVDAGMSEVPAHHMGMMATIINALALQDALERLDVPVRVMTGFEVRTMAEPYIVRRAVRHLEKGRLVILAGGTGNPFFSTDTTAALRGSEIQARLIIKATKVDGVYDQDPKLDRNAPRLPSSVLQRRNQPSDRRHGRHSIDHVPGRQPADRGGQPVARRQLAAGDQGRRSGDPDFLSPASPAAAPRCRRSGTRGLLEHNIRRLPPPPPCLPPSLSRSIPQAECQRCQTTSGIRERGPR